MGTIVITIFRRSPVHGHNLKVTYEMLAFVFIIINLNYRWLSVRLDFLNVACIVGTVVLSLSDRESLSGPVLGLALGTAALVGA